MVEKTEIREAVLHCAREILRDEAISADSNLFLLGASSLDAARLAGALQKLGLKVDLPMVMAFPTVRHLSDQIQRRARRFGVLKPLSGPPPAGLVANLVFVHAISGTLNRYEKLIPNLGSEYFAIGIQAWGIYADRNPDLALESLIDRYVGPLSRLVRLGRDRCSTPTVLLAYSRGGIIALALAHRLVECIGQPVPIILLDTPRRLPPTQDGPSVRRGLFSYLATRSLGLTRKTAEEIFDGACSEDAAIKVLLSRSTTYMRAESFKRMLQLHVAYFLIGLPASFPPYMGWVGLVNAETDERRASRLEQQWRMICPLLQTYPFPVGHSSVLADTHLTDLVSILHSCIQDAVTSHHASRTGVLP